MLRSRYFVQNEVYKYPYHEDSSLNKITKHYEKKDWYNKKKQHSTWHAHTHPGALPTVSTTKRRKKCARHGLTMILVRSAKASIVINGRIVLLHLPKAAQRHAGEAGSPRVVGVHLGRGFV